MNLKIIGNALRSMKFGNPSGASAGRREKSNIAGSNDNRQRTTAVAVSKGEVIFLPESIGNPYQPLLARGLIAQGWTVKMLQYDGHYFCLNRVLNANPDVTVLHMHWVNDYISPVFWSRSSLSSHLKIGLLGLDILVARLRGRTVCWTIHNLVSHESPDPSLEIRARRMIAMCVSRIIIHSRSAMRLAAQTYGMKLSKARVIEHGNYEGEYCHSDARSQAMREALRLPEGGLTLLFFGAIRRYKGLSEFLHAFRSVRRSDVRLVVAGRPHDAELEAELRKFADSDTRIRLMLGVVPDSDVAPLFALADMAVLPFEKTLTSGSTILAMTMGKAVLLPIGGKVFDLIDVRGGAFYGSTDSIPEIIDSLDRDILIEMGARNKSVSDALDWGDIARRTSEVYGARAVPRAPMR